jgi:5-hydroxyisourate hydrolase
LSLSTHVLDTMHGMPGMGVAVTLMRDGTAIFAGHTDADGRCPGLRELVLERGSYQLRFAMADYFRARGVVLPDPPFLDVIAIDFGIAAADAHYHVPLLASPFAYSTYRGS